MNIYFDKNEQFSSNNRTFEGYFEEKESSFGKFQKRMHTLLSALYALLLALTCEKAIRIGKALSVLASLVGMGILFAAIEAGSIGLGMGFFIGLALVGIEYFCLKPNHRHG